MAATHSHLTDAHETLSQSSQKRLLLPKEIRLELLKKLRSAVLDNQDKICAAIKKDLGRPTFETYIAEIAFIKHELDTTFAMLDAWMAPRAVKTPWPLMPATSFVKPTPKGLVLIVGPWNYPFQLTVVPLISAIAAGNCVIIKPSEIAQHSSTLLFELLTEYIDRRFVRVIEGDVDIAKALLELPFDHIFYTGSTQVGSHIMQRAATHLTPVTLELGGKSPCIVDKTCNLPLSVKRILWGKCLNAGQSCVAPDYVLLDKDLISDFIALAQQQLTKMYGKDVEKSEYFGRIVNDRHFNRLAQLLHDGRIAHGGKINAATRFIEPTILVEVNVKSPAMSEEIFGPILPLIGIRDTDEAIAFVNSRPKPLALYIFSNRKSQIQKIVDYTQSGGIAINDCVTQVGVGDLPFGGVGHSGVGHYHGIFGFETFSHLRSVHKRPNWLDNPVKYAPYTAQKLKLAKMIM